MCTRVRLVINSIFWVQHRSGCCRHRDHGPQVKLQRVSFLVGSAPCSSGSAPCSSVACSAHVHLQFFMYKKKVFRCCRVCDGGCQDACNALDLIFVIVFSFGFVCGDSVIAVCSVQQFVELVRVPPVYTAQNFRVPFLEPPRGPTI